MVVLTGGIAAGKTAVSDRFEALGVPVIDTDIIARELVQPGTPLLARIVDEFGEDILDGSAQLDRKRMRQIIFSDSGRRQSLERILHPAIVEQVQERIMALRQNYCLVVVPLLVESGQYRWGDRVLLVDVDEASQITRLISRDNTSPEQARAMLDAQASRGQRLAVADDVIVNSGSLQELESAVAALHEKYRKLAKARNAGEGRSSPKS